MAADDALIGPTASEAGRRLEAIRRALMLQIEALLMRLDQKGGTLASDRDALDNARRIRGQVIALIREEGLPLVVREGEAKIVEAVELMLGPARHLDSPLGAGLSVSLDAQAKDSIARSVSGVLDDVSTVFGDAASDVRAAIDRGLNTSAPLGDLVENVRAKLDTTFARAQVAVETAIRGSARMTLIQQAERGADAADEAIVYLYDGARPDGKIREFCAEHFGKCYSLAALKRMDNGTSLPVVPYAGGFSCRHRLVPMTRDDAIEEGYEVHDA